MEIRQDGFDANLKSINNRLDSIQNDIAVMQSDIEILKEDSTVTRGAVNTLLEWAEEAQVQVKIPLIKKAE